MIANSMSLKESFNRVFRHKRLYNYLAIPIDEDNGIIRCIDGKDSETSIPIDYFKRDWKLDESISSNDIIEKLKDYPDETPATIVYNDWFEPDDGKEHAYLYFDEDEMNEERIFPKWIVSEFTNKEKNDKLNPFTLIMPVKDGVIDSVKQDVDIMNKIRKENEYIKVDDFQGFEFGLIKYLEEKYLRDV